MELIAQGAEARIFKSEDMIVKERPKKGYRISVIDDRLRKFRTRREAKVISTLSAKGLNVPQLISMNDSSMTIEMEALNECKLADCLDEYNMEQLASEIGLQLAKMHTEGVIHGDPTTSNMLLHNNQVYFIDFGLSFFSEKVEDMAVDLHCLRQALESKHHTIWKHAFTIITKIYSRGYKNAEAVLARLEKVEKRGRNKK